MGILTNAILLSDRQFWRSKSVFLFNYGLGFFRILLRLTRCCISSQLKIPAATDAATVMPTLWSVQDLSHRPGRCALAAIVAVILGAVPLRSLAAEAPLPPQTATAQVETITDLSQVWSIPDKLKSVAQPLRIEGRVDVYDPVWRIFWLASNGTGVYLQLTDNPPLMRVGQRVLIEGSLVPSKGLDASTVTVKVLKDYEPVAPLDIKGRINDMSRLGGRIVSLVGYVDRQHLIDDDHVRLELVVEGRPVIGWIKPDNPSVVPNWQGHFVRLTGLYTSRFDPTGTDSTIELWVSRQCDLTVLGSLADDPGFRLPVTPINTIPQIPVGEQVHIRGRIQINSTGDSLIVRDATGQVPLYSAQRQRFAYDAEVEAVGRVEISGAQWDLRAALCRRLESPLSEQKKSVGETLLESVDQIRLLTSEEAARGQPVKITGTVTWMSSNADFFFLQDISGGIRVRFRRDQMDPPRLLQYMAIDGVTYENGIVPAVDLKSYRTLGSMGLPPDKVVTFDQAITGKEDGDWVQMRGFLERAESTGDQRRIYVATASGEFVGLLDSPVNFSAPPGSLIRVRGVCGTVADATGRINGLTLRVPFLHSITTDEDAPVNFYDLPLRPIKSLRELSLVRDFMRVRVSGVVLRVVRGVLVCIEDGQAGLLLLSSETQPLAVGDSIEAVGILGREGVRTVLREAVYRKMSSGASPAPLQLSDPPHFIAALDGRLVSVRGALVDVLDEPARTRMTLQSGNTLFEAVLDHQEGANGPAGVARGAVLNIEGIYHAEFDDARQLRGFRLRLRSWNDVAVVQGVRFWTVQRALAVAALLGLAVLLGVVWVVALRRQVRRQTEQILGQMERQARLEAEVHRSARLESLGVLAGGIAHDFNNLLTVVIGNLSLAMLDAKIAESAAGFLREIERAAYRARDLTQQLLTFARGGDPVRATVALPELVRQAAGSVLHGSSVTCDYEVAPGLWNGDADKDQIAQVVENLVLNAVEAMPNGGSMRISLKNEEIASGAHSSLAAGRYVRVAVMDTGRGIQPEILPRIFDPYFSTKEVGGGLGLATVYSIIKKHGGRIEVESTPGHGASFTFWLPAGDPVTEEAAPPVAEATSAGILPKEARVLLMDDEDGVRRLGAILLARMGAKPTTVRRRSGNSKRPGLPGSRSTW
jgi:signal transduction histidine kinase